MSAAIHLQYSSWHPQCDRVWMPIPPCRNSGAMTRKTSEVTCKSCMKTWEFKKADQEQTRQSLSDLCATAPAIGARPV